MVNVHQGPGPGGGSAAISTISPQFAPATPMSGSGGARRAATLSFGGTLNEERRLETADTRWDPAPLVHTVWHLVTRSVAAGLGVSMLLGAAVLALGG